MRERERDKRGWGGSVEKVWKGDKVVAPHMREAMDEDVIHVYIF